MTLRFGQRCFSVAVALLPPLHTQPTQPPPLLVLVAESLLAVTLTQRYKFAIKKLDNLRALVTRDRHARSKRLLPHMR